MQQVRATVAALRVDDPRRLPVPFRRSGNKVVIQVNRVWVLHRKLILRSVAALAVAFLLALGFHARGGVMQTAGAVSEILSGEFASAGFGVTAIDIRGLSLTDEAAVVAALGMADDTSTVSLDADAARKRIEALPSVMTATVRKVYPGRLVVDLTERLPVARWRIDGVTHLIDAAGNRIAEAAPADERLPLVIGHGASDDALIMIRSLERFPDLNDGLVALSRIADRRWDLVYDTGLRVQLPEVGVAQALLELEGYQKAHQLMDRDLTLIDLRVAGAVAVRLAQRDEEDES